MNMNNSELKEMLELLNCQLEETTTKYCNGQRSDKQLRNDLQGVAKTLREFSSKHSQYPKAEVSKEWICPDCTLLNFTNQHLCQACFKPRIMLETKTSPKSKPSFLSEDWICLSCTLKNSAFRSNCEVCLNPRILNEASSDFDVLEADFVGSLSPPLPSEFAVASNLKGVPHSKGTQGGVTHLSPEISNTITIPLKEVPNFKSTPLKSDRAFKGTEILQRKRADQRTAQNKEHKRNYDEQIFAYRNAAQQKKLESSFLSSAESEQKTLGAVEAQTKDGSSHNGIASHRMPFKPIESSELHLEEVVGRGAFGVVQKARWRGMKVAVKKLKLQCDDNEFGTESTHWKELLEEIYREAEVWQRIPNHECVVQFIGISIIPTPCLITKFMPNGSVESLLVFSNTAVDHKIVMRMAWEAATGIDHLHKEGVFHRDIAARNVLVDEHLHVRVTDFGLARVKTVCASRGFYTRSDLLPIKWSAPEALRHHQYSTSSDVFSFGVLLYEMFVRLPPWKDVTNHEVILRVCAEQERMILPPHLDQNLRQLMQRCWSHESHERPQFSEILDCLAEHSSGVRVCTEDALIPSIPYGNCSMPC